MDNYEHVCKKGQDKIAQTCLKLKKVCKSAMKGNKNTCKSVIKIDKKTCKSVIKLYNICVLW